MNGQVFRTARGRMARTVAALAIGGATIPVVLGALASASAAATPTGANSIGAQQILADVQCDIAWVDYDDAWLNSPAPTVPSCAPVPAGFQVAISNALYNYCEFTLELDGGHGFCIPPASGPKN